MDTATDDTSTAPAELCAALDALETAHARGDLAARWFLRALARGERPSPEHVARVTELERADGG